MKRLIVALALGMGVALVVMPSSATADGGAFTGIARADGFRVAVHAQGSPAEEVTDTSGPTAQAKVDSLGTSEGFAALPYPGDTATTGAGLVGSLVLPQIGQKPPDLPEYPFAVRSQDPGQPKASMSQGPYVLNAESSPGESSAEARAAGNDSGGNVLGSGHTEASVKQDAAAGKVVVDASATLESVTLAGVLRFGRLASTAHGEAKPGEAPQLSSSFTADGVSIAGTPVGITDKGLVLAGTNAPLPDSSPVAQALKGAGIEVRYVAALKDGDAIQSAGLEVVMTQQLPPGTTTMTYSFGKTRVELTASASGGDGAAAGADTGDSGAGFDAPSAEVPSDTGTASLGGGATGPTGPTTAAAPRSLRAGNASGSVPISTTSPFSFYLVLVVGAIVALSGSFVLRYFAVRLAWTS